jgi:hypothetical protein
MYKLLFKKIAPKLGSIEYFDWLKRQSATINIKSFQKPLKTASKVAL